MADTKISGFPPVTTLSGEELVCIVDDPGGTPTNAVITADNFKLDLGTPTTLVGTNITGTAASLTAGNVTTNANLTGHVTSTGNAAVLGSFTVSELSTAISDATLSGNNTGDEPAANLAVEGVVRLATTAETNAGAFATIAVTPNGLGSWTGSSAITTVGTIASGTWQGGVIAEAYLQNQSGTNTGDEVAASLTTAGVVELATGAETNTGTDATRAVTPDGLNDWTGSAQITTLGTISGLVAPATIKTETGTTYAPVSGDEDKMITLNNANPIAVTIPANDSVAFAVGTKLNFMQLGAGAVTVGITSDTLNVNANLTKELNGQYAVATAFKVTSTTWNIFGNLVAA